MTRCSICRLPAASGLLCNKCIKDPFRVEELRALLAEKRKFDELKKTYRKNFAEIRDINSPEFWDKLLVESEDKEKKSPITKDRIKTVAGMFGELRGKLLDVGFGHGFIEEYLGTGSAFNLYGIDISHRAVERLKRTINGDFKVGSILEIPFTNKCFDAVLALEILEHIPPHKTLKAIGELKRVLKRQGILVVSVPLNEGLEELYEKGLNPSGHVRVYTPELMKAELKMAGFRIQKERLLYAFETFYEFKKILQKILFRNRWRPNDIVILAQKP